jgi:hypothetical protein
MSIADKLDQVHARVRGNRWLGYFAVFNRVALSAGFLPSGMVKIMGERFTDLSVNHPMGHYLEALHYTGFYYTFIGIMQLSAAVLLLIPRTALLGALLYFPIIFNIFILTIAVRFEGSLLTSPLMVLANLYLLCWDYHKLKFIFPFRPSTTQLTQPQSFTLSNKFPTLFFAGVGATVFFVGLIVTNIFDLVPRNTLASCVTQCDDSNKSKACYDFCDCIHQDGRPINQCLDKYNKSPKDIVRTP